MDQLNNLKSLSFEEQSILNDKKEAVKKDHEEYISSHPEIQTILNNFMTAILIEKPDDVVGFAKEYFSMYKPIRSNLEPLIIAGPSGVGKGTLINMLMTSYPSVFGFSVSHTTRDPRPGEVGGVAYHFSKKEQVEEEIAQDKFLEYANVHGNIYGTSKQAVQDVKDQEKICILDIDIQGVKQLKLSDLKCKYLFISPPSMKELEQRLRGRATETEEKIKLRVQNSKSELEYGRSPGAFDANVINSNLEECYKSIVQLLREWYPELQEFKK